MEKRWFNWDVAGVICAGLTLFLIAFADYVVCIETILPWNSYELTVWSVLNIFFFNCFVVLAIVSHYKAVTTDPGTVPLPPSDYVISEIYHNNEPFKKFDEYVTICKKCQFYKPLYAHHCSTCKRCVRKMDHHCPWINNCVGERNQKHFLLFLLYIGISSTYAGVVVGTRLYDCTKYGIEGCGMTTPIKQTVVSALLMFESILFGLFVIIMMGDQLRAISSTLSGIDRMKAKALGDQIVEGSEKRSFRAKIGDVFGGGEMDYTWLLPVNPPNKSPSWFNEIKDV